MTTHLTSLQLLNALGLIWAKNAKIKVSSLRTFNRLTFTSPNLQRLYSILVGSLVLERQRARKRSFNIWHPSQQMFTLHHLHLIHGQILSYQPLGFPEMSPTDAVRPFHRPCREADRI